MKQGHRQLVHSEWHVYEQELRRKLPSGKTVPVEQDRAELRVARDTSSGRHLDPDHPSRKHDSSLVPTVELVVRDQPVDAKTMQPLPNRAARRARR